MLVPCIIVKKDVGAVHNRERFLLETFTIMHGTNIFASI